jgi:hypothetical protein
MKLMEKHTDEDQNYDILVASSEKGRVKGIQSQYLLQNMSMCEVIYKSDELNKCNGCKIRYELLSLPNGDAALVKRIMRTDQKINFQNNTYTMSCVKESMITKVAIYITSLKELAYAMQKLIKIEGYLRSKKYRAKIKMLKINFKAIEETARVLSQGI